MKKLLFLMMCLGMSSNVFSMSPRVIASVVKQVRSSAKTLGILTAKEVNPRGFTGFGSMQAIADVVRLSGERLPWGYGKYVSVDVSRATVRDCLADPAACSSNTIKAVNAAAGGDTLALKGLLTEGLGAPEDFKHVQLAAYLSGDVKTVKLVEKKAAQAATDANFLAVDAHIDDPIALERYGFWGTNPLESLKSEASQHKLEMDLLLKLKNEAHDELSKSGKLLSTGSYLHDDSVIRFILSNLTEGKGKRSVLEHMDDIERKIAREIRDDDHVMWLIPSNLTEGIIGKRSVVPDYMDYGQ